MLTGKQDGVAQVSIPDESARTALRVFSHCNLRPGEVATDQDLLAMVAKWDIRADDINQGLARGLELGWFERAGNGFRLTEAGFKEM